MTQPTNNITAFFIADPNGGQSQMIKVMGGTKIPIQLASASSSTVSPSAIKNFIKTSAGNNSQGPTVIPATKIQNRQILALPTKQNINVQNIRGSMVVPVSNVQLKPNIPVVSTVRGTTSMISSPMVIRTQTGALAVASAPSSTQNHIQLPSINVNKQASSVNVATANIQVQKPNVPGTSFKSSSTSLPIKTASFAHQSALNSKQQSEIIYVQQKGKDESNQQKPSHLTMQHNPRIKPLQQIQQQVSQAHHAVNSPKSLMNTSILDHSGSRKRHDFDFEYNTESKKRRPEKGGKGLRHFSMKVCEKVQAKGTTTYNEVADELVNEFTESSRSHSPTDGINYDQKNIRRRVYDALNVLMAMNIISKEKKEIRWIGLPTNSLQECHRLQQERKKRMQQIRKKTQQLQDLILQQIAFKNLVERNKRFEKENGAPPPNSAIQLPFIIVNTNRNTVIDCSISNDKTEYLFNFDDTFEIHDDIEVLKRMGMAVGLDKGVCTAEDLERVKSLVPKNLESYVTELAEGKLDNNSVDMAAVDDLISLDFEKIGANKVEMDSPATTCVEEIKEEHSLSRHSSLLSLQDQRTESGSPSSIGEEFDFDLEDSDVEIS